jgi:membrane associated rhomboid family serine protease/Flp pilus assembly protein TadD
MQEMLREPILRIEENKVESPRTDNGLTSKPKRSWTSPPAPLTGILMVMSIAAFAAMFTANGNLLAFLLPVPERLLWWGANYMPFTFGMGEYWRLATGLFAHAGVLHLLTNLYVLHDLGSSLERTIGWRRYLLMIFTCGAAASLSAVTQDPTLVSCGLSGIIFGIVSCLFLMSGSPQGKDLVFARQRWLVLVFIGYMLLLGFITQGVDNAAHIAGLLTGCLFGMIYSKRGWTRQWSSVDSVVSFACVLLVGSVFGVAAFWFTERPDLVRLAQCRNAVTVAKWDKDYASAIRLMDKAIGEQCADPVLYITRAGFYYEVKRYPKAVDDYTAVLSLKPNDHAALAGRSIAYHFMGEEQKAIDDLNVLIHDAPHKALPYNNRAWSLLALGRPESALLDCEHSLSLDSRLTTAYDTKAVALLNLHRLNEALYTINQCITMTGGDGAAYYHRAKILNALGRSEESVQDFMRAERLQYNPEPWEEESHGSSPQLPL